MSTTRKILDSNVIFGTMLVWLVFLAAVHFWPASYWLEVRSVRAGPAKEGEAVPMLVARTIHRPFLGIWTATVRKWEGDGWVTYCTSSGSSQYKSGSELPAKLTLDWWTDGRCPSLTAGRYVLGTVWQINPLAPFLPAKSVQSESDIFEVTP